MSAPLVIFLFGYILGIISALWLGGRLLLYRMHHDDIENAHKNYRNRKEKYL